MIYWKLNHASGAAVPVAVYIYLAAALCLPLVESGTEPTISNP